jgi:hypothetical protein
VSLEGHAPSRTERRPAPGKFRTGCAATNLRAVASAVDRRTGKSATSVAGASVRARFAMQVCVRRGIAYRHTSTME